VSDADIKELIEATKGLIEANYALLTELNGLLRRYGFNPEDPRYKPNKWFPK